MENIEIKCLCDGEAFFSETEKAMAEGTGLDLPYVHAFIDTFEAYLDQTLFGIKVEDAQRTDT